VEVAEEMECSSGGSEVLTLDDEGEGKLRLSSGLLGALHRLSQGDLACIGARL